MSALTTAHRNCWLSWAIGRIREVEQTVNHAVYLDRQSDRVTRIQADDALAAAELLDRMAADLRAIAARRVPKMERAA